MRKVFLSFLGKIGQVLEVLINPGEARVGSEVSWERTFLRWFRSFIVVKNPLLLRICEY